MTKTNLKDEHVQTHSHIQHSQNLSSISRGLHPISNRPKI